MWTSLWERPEEIPHIALVREAEVFAIVPATANVIAKIAYGIADDLLTNAALAARIPLIVAPAMNTAMLEHPATVDNLRTLEARGVDDRSVREQASWPNVNRSERAGLPARKRS